MCERSGRGAATCRASLADALVQVAGTYLTPKIAAAGTPDIYQVIVHVGPEALTTGPDRSNPATGRPGVSAETSAGPPAGGAARPACRLASPAHPERCHLEDGPAISPAAAQALACHATVSWMLHDHDGNLLDAGRRHRLAPAPPGGTRASRLKRRRR